jgi:hypothetical protein
MAEPLSVATIAVVAGAVVVKGLTAPVTVPAATLVVVALAGIKVGQLLAESGLYEIHMRWPETASA